MSISNELEISNRLKKYYKFTIVALFFLVIAVFLFLFSHKPALAPESPQMEFKNFKINGHIINVEIADTIEKQTKGLSGRRSLPENQGMLFVFNTPGYYSFWMKDMNFGLDFIWINGDKIVEITENIKPEDYEPPKLLVSKNKIDKVLEVNAGIAEKLGIEEGDRLEF